MGEDRISIFEDLKRLRVKNNKTQQSSQIDELKHKNEYWLFKYDFRIAGSNQSTKSSGNRIVGFIDNTQNQLDILLIYNKNDLPKNKKETQFIEDVILQNYHEIEELFK